MIANGMDSCRYLWDEKFIAGDSFCKLLSMTIVSCSKLQLIFPSNIHRRFQRLENLTVSECSDVEEIYQYEGVNLEDDNVMQTFSLQQLHIWSLQSLKHIWSKTFGSKFRSLQSVFISKCEDLEYVFPESIACDLVQLQHLGIGQCGAETIIAKKSKGCPASFEFPELISIELARLNKMRSVCEGSHVLALPKLKSLQLYDCDNLQAQESMPSVEKFIPKLEELTINDQGLKVIQYHSGAFPAELFSKLKRVVVWSVDPESIQFLFNFLKRLKSVEILVFLNGSFDSESLANDEKADGDEEHHSRLKHLELRYLAGLEHLFKKESPLGSILQHLQTFVVDNGYDLIDIAPSSTSFWNLTTLHVSYCNKLTKLVTSSTAKTMVQLLHLRVDYCYAIEEIIAVDAKINTKHDVIIFNKLKCLELENLSEINSFCSGHCTFVFPLLEKVIVKSCPKMKNFCSGVVSTPGLRGIIFDGEQEWEGDLNATIACQLRQWVGVHFDEWKIFQSVESVELVKDASTLKVISASQMQLLHRLKRIVVKDCESVQVVFDLEGRCVEYFGILPKLEELRLINLPMLSKLCSNLPESVVDFNKLRVLEIENCGMLKYVFTWSMAARLVQLQTIQVRNCEQMERIIEGEEVDGAVAVVFCSLANVDLECLPKLSGFYSGYGALECPSLEYISIRKCPSIRAFISRLAREEGKKAQNIHFCHQVLPCLNELSLDIKSIDAILKAKLPTNYFMNVKKLFLLYCSVKTAGSCVHLLQFLSGLPSLGELVIHTSAPEELLKFEILEEAMTLPQITSFKLQNVAEVKHIWWHASLFQSLRTLEVVNCKDLIYLITPSFAKSMVQLEKLSVRSCDMLKEIVGNGNDGTMDVLFTKMKTLELFHLPSLQRFSSGRCTFQFPCLENIFLIGCPNLKFFCDGSLNAPKLYDVKHGDFFERQCCWEGDVNATIQRLYTKMVCFRHLKDVKLSTFPLLKEKWCDQIPLKYFCELKNLAVDDNALISKAISHHLLPELKWLEELKVENCEAVEQVFDLEGLNAFKCGRKHLKKLNQLRLVDLPRLRHVWSKDPHRILSLRDLQLLEVHNCGKLTYIFDLSMALRLPRLKHVEVNNCSLVKHIIVKEEEETMQEFRTIFPSLQSISLQHLTSLSGFYDTNEFLECPSLKMIEVVECPNMELFPSTFSNGQQISSENPNSTLAFLGNLIAIQGLEELKVEWNRLKPIFNDENQPEFLSRVKLIDLIGLPGEYTSLPPNFHGFFPKLEKLSLGDSSMEEINLHELSYLDESLAMLTKLKFLKLPKLKHLDFPRAAIFQNLEVAECSRLKILVPPSVSFQNLTNLQVSNCDGMMNLITSSTARSLVQLKKMEVKECKKMEEIIAVESDGGEHEIRFGQLECLELVDLPSLESFCLGKFDLDFPSLEKVAVIGCPNMKKFASSATPKLNKVTRGRRECEWEWDGNLNDTIEALYAQKDDEELDPQEID